MKSAAYGVSRKLNWKFKPHSAIFYRKDGVFGTLGFRIEYFIRPNGTTHSKCQRISPWHHISIIESPVTPDGDTLSMIVEEDSRSLPFDSKELVNCSFYPLHQADTNGYPELIHSNASMLLSLPNVFVNMVIEIPKFTREKMEISTSKEGNPIIQDLKNEELRLWLNSMYWNYGAIPQTWENPTTGGKYLECKKKLVKHHLS